MSIIQCKVTTSIEMREIDSPRVRLVLPACWCDNLNIKKLLVVLECLKDGDFDSAYCLRFFVIMPLVRSELCGMLTKVCRARINYLKLSCFLHYPLMV